MEPCRIETRKIPGIPYVGEWCVTHNDNPSTWDRSVDGWVCSEYIAGKRREERPQDATLRALGALSKALEDTDRGMWYSSGNDVAMEALTAVKTAVDQAIRELGDV